VDAPLDVDKHRKNAETSYPVLRVPYENLAEAGHFSTLLPTRCLLFIGHQLQQNTFLSIDDNAR
jgi:hypothetical protein